MNFIFVALISAASAAPASQTAREALIVPDEVSGASIGMSVNELLEARPRISRQGMLGEQGDPSTSPNANLFETLKGTTSVFTTAAYIVREGKVTGIALSGSPSKADERQTRKEALSRISQLWGPPTKRVAEADRITKGGAVPVLIWERQGIEGILILPRNRGKDDSKANPFSLQIRTKSPKNKELKDTLPDDAARGRFFKDHDVD